MAKVPASVGARIREAREKSEMTQQDIAQIMGLSRAAVAQWESDTTSPSIHKVGEIAKLLSTSPQWLAFGVSLEPKVVYQSPAGSVNVPEVMFGDKPTEQNKVRDWQIPADYLKSELHAMSTDGLVIWRVENDSMAPSYEYGDKVIIDTNAKKPSPSGVFLLWDGIGPSLANVSITPGNGKPVARVSGSGNAYEVPADKLQVIGRVRGVLKNV